MKEKRVTLNLPADLYNDMLKVAYENKRYNVEKNLTGKVKKPDSITQLIKIVCEKAYKK